MTLSGRRIAFVGCGSLGGDAAARMARAGADVHGLRRSPARVPEGVTGVAADVRSDAPLPLPLEGGGLDAVVVALTPGDRTPEAYRATYVGGVGKTLDAARAAGAAPLVVFVSSTGVYGQSRGEVVTEESPAEPARETARALREAERLLESADLPTITLRLGGIYGPGRERLVESVRSGRATLPRGVTEWTNRIHRTDAARAIVFAVERGLGARAAGSAPDHEVFDVVDAAPSPRAEVLTHIASELGVAPPAVVEPAADAPPETGKRVTGDRLRAAGFELTVPTYRDGYVLR